MHHVVRRVGFALVAVVVLGSVAAVSAGGAGPATAVSNETNLTHHENPAAAGGEGDAERVRGWLSDRLTEQLREHSVRVSEGEYEAAEGLLDEEFQQRLSQYAEVEGETGDGGSGGESSSAIDRAGTNQRRLGDSVGTFEDTYEDYQDARDSGDSDAAHRHARRLGRITERIERRSENATRALGTIQNQTSTGTTDVRERIAVVREEAVRRHEQVQEATFVETTVKASAEPEVASFTEPTTIRGTVRMARGEPIADKQITVRIGERSYTVETDGEGRFARTYRPVTVRADATEVDVTYRPDDETPYLPSSATVDLEIRQVTPNVSVTAHHDEAGYGTEVAVATGVSVDGQAVPGAPVQTSISGTAIGGASTARTGVVHANWSVPADVPIGDGLVQVSVATADRAVGPANATTPITVEETETALSVSPTVEDGVLSVSGRLSLDADREASLPAALPVEVSVAGHSETVRTGSDGGFELSVARSALDVTGESATVRANFEGKETNLGPATAERTATFDTTTSENALPGSETVFAIGIAALVVLLAVVGMLVRRRRRSTAVPGDDSTVDVALSGAGADGGPRTNGVPEAESGEQYSEERWLAGARAALVDGSIERAVASAYAAAHANVTARLGFQDVLTPRELLRAAEGELGPERHESFVTLTTLYEQVIFASDPADGAGERAIEAAVRVLDTESPTRTGGDDRQPQAESR